MTMIRSILLIAALAAAITSAHAQSRDGIASPTLRADVRVSGEIVRIGDLIDNAGPAADIAIYRAPDPGTTGTLPVTQVLATLRAHQVIGVDTRNMREIAVTRLARTIERRDVEAQVALALEKRGGVGDAANLSITFDRDIGVTQLDAKNTGAMTPVSVRYEPRSHRFDVTFEILGDDIAAAQLRVTGTAIETVEVAILMRGVERNELIRMSDVTVERRPRAEIGNDPAGRDQAVGMQARRQLRAGQPLRAADLVRPDLVQRDQSVMLIYETAGIYLTIRGKALESGAEGDVVSVLNLQSKRTISGIVIGRGQIAIETTPLRAPTAAAASAAPSSTPVALAAADRAPVSRPTE